MKKISLSIIFICLVLIITSCTKTGTTIDNNIIDSTDTKSNLTIEYIDNIYSARETDFSIINGYRDEIIICIDDGKISKVTFNGYDNKGRNKVEESKLGGSYDMSIAGSTVPWSEQANKLENYLIETQDISSIEVDENGYSDTVAGVTIKVKTFVDLTNQALETAIK